MESVVAREDNYPASAGGEGVEDLDSCVAPDLSWYD